MDRLQNIETFVRVAQTQSFAEAARQLRVSKSVVTTRIKQLEAYLGAPLFHRSTRIVRLSELGQMFFADSTQLVAHASNLVDQMRDARGKPEGTLRIHALTSFAVGHFGALLHEFQVAYPKIRLDLVLSDAVVDPVKAGVDCALQIFPAASIDLVARPLFAVRRVFCATPNYLKCRGVPDTPRDLHEHTLALYSGYPTRDRFTFHDDGDELTTYLNAALLTNSVHLLREYTLKHAGIACLPTYVAGDAILDGRLQIVLPRYQLPSFRLRAVHAPTLRNTFKLNLFIEYIRSVFGRIPPWDASLIQAGLLPERLIES